MLFASKGCGLRGDALQYGVSTSYQLKTLFKRLIRQDTSNPPGRETRAARVVRDYLHRAGISARTPARRRERASVVAHLPGRTEEHLILLSHLDVVPAPPEGWRYPPFAAHEAGGKIYGRGAIDIKRLVAQSACLLAAAKRERWPLRRGLTVLAAADEEEGGAYGARHLMASQPSLFRRAYCLGEGGGLCLRHGGRNICLFSFGERGWLWFRLVLQAAAGHASFSRRRNRLYDLAPILEGLERLNEALPVRWHPRVARSARRLVEIGGGRPHASRFDRQLAQQAGDLACLISTGCRDTLQPTMAAASPKINVLPQSVALTVDGRVAVGGKAAALLRELRRVFTPLGARVEVLDASDPTESPPEGELAEAVAASMPAYEMIPFVQTGGTDMRFLRRLGVPCYGFSPMKIEGSLQQHYRFFHGVDEHLSVENLEMGYEVLRRVIKNFCL